MKSSYDLTPTQISRWQSAIDPLFTPHATYMELAENIARPHGTKPKTIAGYIGEFRKGHPRALRYFLGEHRRLVRLASALGNTSADEILQTWADLHSIEEPPPDSFYLAGFEDWGPVRIDEGLLPPPLLRGGIPLKIGDLELEIVKRIEAGLTIAASPDAGATSLVRLLAYWASRAGWTPTWWRDGTPLPQQPGSLLIIDNWGTRPSDRAIEEWKGETGHGLIEVLPAVTGHHHRFQRTHSVVKQKTRLVEPTEIRLFERTPRRHLLPDQRSAWMLICPVDDEWIDTYRDQLMALATPMWRRRLKKLSLRQAKQTLSTMVEPGPGVGGALLRQLSEGRESSTAQWGPQQWLEAGKRRLRANGHQQQLTNLESLATWPLDLIEHELREAPRSDFQAMTKERSFEEAKSIIDGLSLPHAQRVALYRLLPAASTDASLQLLELAGLARLQESGTGDHVRERSLLLPALASRALDDEEIIRLAAVRGWDDLLQLIARSAEGATAIAESLDSMEVLELAAAVADRNSHLQTAWLQSLPWCQESITRFLAIRILLHEGRHYGITLDDEVALHKAGPHLVVPEIGVLRELVASVPPDAPRPTLEALLTCCKVFARDLGLRTAQVTPEVARLLLSIALPDPADAADDELTQSASRRLLLPERWLERGNPADLGWLLDLSRSTTGRQCLRYWSEDRNTRAMISTTSIKPPPEDRIAKAWHEKLTQALEVDPKRAAGWIGNSVDWAINVISQNSRTSTGTPQEGAVQREYADIALTGIAWALTRAPARRARQIIQPALRSSLEPLFDQTEQGDLATEGTAGLFPRSRAKGQTDEEPLAVILRFALDTNERRSHLRLHNGAPSPLWRQLADSGGLSEDVIEMAELVANGQLPITPGALEGTMKEPIDRWMLQNLNADQLPRGMGWPTPNSGAIPPESAWDHAFGNHQIRRYLWCFHRSLEPDDPIWDLLADRNAGDHDVAATMDSEWFQKMWNAVPKGIYRACRKLDLEMLRGVLASPALDKVDEVRLLVLADHFTLADTPVEFIVALLDRLDTLDPSEATEGTRAHLLRCLLAKAPDVARERIISELQVAPARLDNRVFALTLVEASTPTKHVEEAIEHLIGRGPCGEGLLVTLAKTAPSRLGQWLGHQDSQQAAIAALLELDEIPESIEGVLGDGEQLPSIQVLEALASAKGHQGLAILEAAVEDWKPRQRRALWCAPVGLLDDPSYAIRRAAESRHITSPSPDSD